MTLLHAFLLGILEGLTEFIPVSSTAHILVVSKLLGVPSDSRTFSFLVIVQLGSVIALMVYFNREIWQITRSFFIGIVQRKPFDEFHARLGWLVLLATIPALITGFLLKDVVVRMFQDPLLLAGIRLLITALVLVVVENFDKHSRTLESATWLDALTVGLFQVLAIFPGASRSGVTIAGGMTRGFDRPSAARLAFLMSGPILLAAGAYESVQVIAMPGTRLFLPHLVVGFVTSAVVGWLAIKWLIDYLSRRSLYLFAAYCALLGTILLIAILF